MSDDRRDEGSMKRRRLLVAAASVSAATTLAGCRTNFDDETTTQDGGSTTGTATSGTETGTPETTTAVELDGDRAGAEPCQAPLDPDPGPECNAPETIDSDVVTDTTLGEDCNRYVVEGRLEVRQGSTLTVRPGTVLRFEEGVSLVVEGGGSLVAEGTCADPVIFSGTATNRGHWNGIVVDGTGGNRLSYCVVEYAGGESSVGPGRAGIVADNGASLSLTNSTVRQHTGHGLALGGDVAVPRLENNAFLGNTEGAAVVEPAAVRALSGENRYVGNGTDLVRVAPGDPIGPDEAHTWESLGVPYRVEGDVGVGGELTLRPGNTLSFAQGTGIDVDGELFAIGSSGEPIVCTGTKKRRGHWRGIAVSGSSETSASMANVTVEYAGRGVLPGVGRTAAIGFGTGATGSMENCTLRDSDGYGLAVAEGGRLEGFSGNALTGNRSGAAAVPSPVVDSLTADNEYSGNAEDVVDVTVTAPVSRGESRTWAGIDATYRIDAEVDVRGTLILRPGADLAFAPRAALVVEGGRLEAVGRPDQRITFTGATKQPGIWQGIKLAGSSSELRNCLIEFGGGERFSGAARPANVSVSDGATVKIDDSVVRASDAYGFDLGPDATLESFAGNEVTANGSGPGIVRLGSAGEVTADSTYGGNEADAVEVLADGEVPAGSEYVWEGLDVPYLVRGDVVIKGRLELLPGTTLSMAGDNGLEVRSDGTLNAVGTEDRRITVTGSRERSGHWNGINFQDSAMRDNELHYCRIRYGGGTRFVHARVPANVALTLSSYASVENCEIASSAGVGLHATSDATLQADDNTYRYNEAGATEIE